MASLSLKNFFPTEETSSLLVKTDENTSDFIRLQALVFKKLALGELPEEELLEMEALLSRYR